MKVNISNTIVSINKNQEKEIYKELEKNGISFSWLLSPFITLSIVFTTVLPVAFPSIIVVNSYTSWYSTTFATWQRIVI